MIDLFRRGPVRLAFGFTLAVSLATLTGLGLIYWNVSTTLEVRREAIVASQASAILGQNKLMVQRDLQTWLQDGLLLYSVAGLFDAAGRPIAGNLTALPPGLVLDGKVHDLDLPRSLVDQQDATDVPARVLMAGLRRPDGTVLVVGRTLSEVSALRHQITDVALFGSAALFLVVLVLATRESAAQTKRLREIRTIFARVVDGALDERLPIHGKGGDLDRLAGDVNRMLDRLQQLVFEVKDVGDNIAHDLRTPLSILRARLERALLTRAGLPALQASVASSLADLDRALGSISALLRLAEIENGQRRAGFQPVDIAQVCHDAFELYQPIAEQADTHLVEDVEDRLPLFGDADLLVEAVTNLLDNAIKFTPGGGCVTLAARRQGSFLIVSVTDTGIGFPQEERQHLGKRFYRADKSRHHPGTGLGLSLVRAIADLHGFTLSVSDNRPCGSVFTLSRRIDDARTSSFYEAAEPQRPRLETARSR